jgi:hypothetical protein
MEQVFRIKMIAPYFSFLAGNLRPHRRASRPDTDEQLILTDGFNEDDSIGIIGRRRRVRTTTKGNIVVVNEFASELLYLMRTATDMLM